MHALYNFWLWPHTYIKMLVVTKWLITRHMLIHSFLLKMTQNNIMNFETPVCNVQCDAQNTKHQVQIYALLQSPFKFWSSANQHGHSIPVPKG